MELSELLTRCRKGDQLAWEALVRHYQGRVYGLTLSYMRNAEEARDAAQEIFVRVYNKLDTFREQDPFLPWLLRLGRNVCIDLLRRAKARPADKGAPLEEVPDFADTRSTPEGVAETHSRQRLVYRALDMLSEPYREMILLKEIQGLKLEEIASMLELPVGTVKSRSNRARIELARAVLEICPTAGSGAI